MLKDIIFIFSRRFIIGYGLAVFDARCGRHVGFPVNIAAFIGDFGHLDGCFVNDELLEIRLKPAVDHFRGPANGSASSGFASAGDRQKYNYDENKKILFHINLYRSKNLYR